MIDILLSTYNGGKYLKEQIESIIQQTTTCWYLLIRDDGSSDNTIELIYHYQNLYPDKIEIIEDAYGNMKSTKSFAALLERSTAPYIMFCDQDDIWLPHKIELTLQMMKLLEVKYMNKPLLVFSDLILYANTGDIINNSFIRSQNMKPDVVHNIWMCLAMSVAPGCTIMINRVAKKLVLPMPSFVVHDYWMVAIICYYGKCEFIDTPTMYYRIHECNSVGVNKIGKCYLMNKLKNMFSLFPQYRDIFDAFPFKVNFIKVFFYKMKFNLLRFLGVKLYK